MRKKQFILFDFMLHKRASSGTQNVNRYIVITNCCLSNMHVVFITNKQHTCCCRHRGLAHVFIRRTAGYSGRVATCSWTQVPLRAVTLPVSSYDLRHCTASHLTPQSSSQSPIISLSPVIFVITSHLRNHHSDLRNHQSSS